VVPTQAARKKAFIQEEIYLLFAKLIFLKNKLPKEFFTGITLYIFLTKEYVNTNNK